MAIGPTIENLRKKRAEEAALLEMLYALPTPTGGFDVNTPAELAQLETRGLRGREPYSERGMDFGRQRPDRGTIDVMPQQPAEFYAREVSRGLLGPRATNDLFGYPQGTGNLVGDILTGGGMLGAIGATAPLTAWDAGAAAARGDYGDAALKSVFSLLEGAGLGELATGARGLRAVANEFPEAAQEVGQRVRGFLADESGSVPLPLGKPTLDVSRRDASDIFGAGSERVRYTDPNSGGTIEVVVRPDGSASVLELEVPEAFRGRGIGQTLQARALQDFPKMGGQVSSKAAATTAYRLGRRPQGNPDATLDDVFAAIDDMSSVNMVSPAMQTTPAQARGFLAGENGALRLFGGGVADPTNTGWTFRDMRKPDLSHEENKRLQSMFDRTAWQETELPIGRMIATQPTVNADFATTLSSQDRLPVVVQKGNELFVRDGHHRLVKAAQAGKTKAKVALLNLDPRTETPLLDYRKPAPWSAEDDALLAELMSMGLLSGERR